MDLFTYLLAKNDKASIVHKGDLFSYLLGRNAKGELKTATGTNIYITDAIKTKINKLLMTKESTQDGTPSPDYPQEVKTVKGYRNLFDKDNVTRIYGYITGNNWQYSVTAYSFRIACQPNTNYVLSASNTSETIFRAGVTDSDSIPTTDDTITLYSVSNYGNTNTPIYITTGANAKYIVVQFGSSNATTSIQTLQLVEGTEELPYVPYGTNWVYTKITNGTDTNYYTIPLNNNEIAGLGNYKDELIVDKNGHCWLNKKIGKVVLDGSENWNDRPNYIYSDRFVLDTITIPKLTDVYGFCNYFRIMNNVINTFPYLILNNGQQIVVNFSTKGTTTLAQFKEWLSEHNTEIYYPTLTEDPIDLNYTVDIELFKGINNISNSDDMNMTLEYY